MDRNDVIEIQKAAASALEAGARLANRAADRRIGREQLSRPSGAALGALLANPAAFWSGAATVEAYGDGESVEPLAHAVKYAAAKLAAGDLDFVRESLIGQSQWCGVLAVKLMQRAENEPRYDRSVGLIKLALAAQRQAATSLATAAALNRLEN